MSEAPVDSKQADNKRKLRRALIAGVVVIVVLNVLAFTLDRFGGARPGPASSSYTTAPEGAAAYADLLARSGHPVLRLRARLSESTPPSDATVVLLDPGPVPRAEASSLREFLERGGRLVAGGTIQGSWLEELMDSPPEWSAAGETTVVPLVPAPEVAGVSEISTAGIGAWEDPASTLPLVGSDETVTATVATVGRGRVVLLADTSPLRNNFLARSDNAAFGLNLAGETGRPVAFVESVHGYEDRSGLAAIPSRWKWALGGLTAAVLVYMLSRGRRLGPPQQAERDLPPARSEYIEALAGILARTGDTETVAKHLRRNVRSEIGRRASLPADAPDSEFETWARRFGLDEYEARAIARPGNAETDLLLLGRSVANLRQRKVIHTKASERTT